MFFISCTSLFSLPQNPSIHSGIVNFKQNGAALEIAASDKSIVNWDQFSILEGEKVCFTLADPAHSTLSRVIGSNQSQIWGDLVCNGKLILINPSGIVFAESAKVDTGSLIATSLNLRDVDFLEGHELNFFDQHSERIVNKGILNSSKALYLIAPSVVQDGICISKEAEVLISSCTDVVLNGPDGKIQLDSKGYEFLGEEGIHLGGTIKALEACLLSDSMSALAINLTGLIDAEKVQIQAEDSTVNLSGTILSKHLEIDAGQIEIAESARIDLSSPNQGGYCRIQGTNWILMNSGAIIDASSKFEGDAGEVILLSNGTTRFQGSIFAEAYNGDGGFVEVSGPNLGYKGFVSTQSALGNTGTLLLDPYDITISNSASALVNGLPNGPFVPMASACFPGPGNAILDDTDLINALMVTNVDISTVGTGGMMCNGDIIFDDTAVVSYNSANSLTLSAEGSIHFQSSVVNAGAGSISITQAGGDVNVVAVDTSISVESNGGPISITGVAGDLNITGGALMGNFARILAPNATLDVNVAGDINVTGGGANGAFATLRNTVGLMTVSAANINVLGGTVSGASADIFSGTNANMNVTCGTMTVNTTASGATVGVSADGDLNLNVTGGDLQILADAGGFALVNASFEVQATVAQNILLSGSGGGFATMFGDRENATIEATNGSITMNGATQIYSGNLPNQSLLLIAGTSIFANGTASLDVFSATGTLTIVVDNLFPSSPGLGSGQFVLGPSAIVNAGGNQLQIFSALPSQNTIQGMLNGVPFAPGVDNERFGVYYPNPFFVSDYVIFYKIPNDIPDLPPSVLAEILTPEFVDFAEFFRVLHPYSEYIYGSVRFEETYQDPEQLLGYSPQRKDRFILRRKSMMQDWFEIKYDPDKF